MRKDKKDPIEQLDELIQDLQAEQDQNAIAQQKPQLATVKTVEMPHSLAATPIQIPQPQIVRAQQLSTEQQARANAPLPKPLPEAQAEQKQREKQKRFAQEAAAMSSPENGQKLSANELQKVMNNLIPDEMNQSQRTQMEGYLKPQLEKLYFSQDQKAKLTSVALSPQEKSENAQRIINTLENNGTIALATKAVVSNILHIEETRQEKVAQNLGLTPEQAKDLGKMPAELLAPFQVIQLSKDQKDNLQTSITTAPQGGTQLPLERGLRYINSNLTPEQQQQAKQASQSYVPPAQQVEQPAVAQPLSEELQKVAQNLGLTKDQAALLPQTQQEAQGLLKQFENLALNDAQKKNLQDTIAGWSQFGPNKALTFAIKKVSADRAQQVAQQKKNPMPHNIHEDGIISYGTSLKSKEGKYLKISLEGQKAEINAVFKGNTLFIDETQKDRAEKMLRFHILANDGVKVQYANLDKVLSGEIQPEKQRPEPNQQTLASPEQKKPKFTQQLTEKLEKIKNKLSVSGLLSSKKPTNPPISKDKRELNNNKQYR